MLKVLIIDDDPHLRAALELRLVKENFQVTTAQSGVQGLEAAEKENPNLIVLDLAMPDIDGLEVLNRLRKSPVTWDIPVVVLSAISALETREQIRSLRVARFLQKPFSPKDLVAEIIGVLRETLSSS